MLGTIVLAWGAAALAHLAFGTPEATPSIEQVTASLADLGVAVDDLRLAPEQSWGGTTFLAGADGDLAIRVVGRDSSDAHLASKLWRFLWYKDSEPTLTLTRGYQIEHQAYVLLLAGRTGARVPDLVAAGLAGWRDDAVLVVRNPEGDRLTDVDPERLTDSVLDDAWEALGRLHGARIAHGDPWAGNVVLDAGGAVGLVGLTGAVAAASDGRAPTRPRAAARQHGRARRRRPGPGGGPAPPSGRRPGGAARPGRSRRR